MKIGFNFTLGPEWEKLLTPVFQRFPEADFVFGMAPCVEQIASLDVLVALPMEHDVIKRAGSLKVIFIPFVGINHLPIDTLMEKGIRVINSHGNARSVAERALAMTLAFYGKIIEFHNDLAQERWHGFWVKKGLEDTWESIVGKPCTVLGTGAIGKEIARLMKAFDCRVVGYKKRPRQEAIEHFDEIRHDLTEALAPAEIVFVALPLTNETAGLLNRDVLGQMKGKFIVNVGRGDIIEEKALFDRLADGTLKGAAIDAWYTYPESGKTAGSPSRHPIHRLANTVLSPHVAGFTAHAAAANIAETIKNLDDYLAGRDPANEVDLSLMY